jgi:hypothetical protein
MLVNALRHIDKMYNLTLSTKKPNVMTFNGKISVGTKLLIIIYLIFFWISHYSDGLDGRGLILGRGKKCSLFRSVQTCSGTHPVAYPMDTGGEAAGA